MVHQPQQQESGPVSATCIFVLAASLTSFSELFLLLGYKNFFYPSAFFLRQRHVHYLQKIRCNEGKKSCPGSSTQHARKPECCQREPGSVLLSHWVDIGSPAPNYDWSVRDKWQARRGPESWTTEATIMPTCFISGWWSTLIQESIPTEIGPQVSWWYGIRR